MDDNLIASGKHEDVFIKGKEAGFRFDFRTEQFRVHFSLSKSCGL